MPATKSLHEVLSYIQVHLVALKDKQTKGGGAYNYRTCEGIIAAVKTFLEQFNLTLTFEDSYDLIPVKDDITTKIVYHAKAVLSNGKERAEGIGYASVAEKLASMSEPQIWGSTMSYARKYALGSLFAIDNEKDIDSENVKETTNEKIERAKKEFASVDNDEKLTKWGQKFHDIMGNNELRELGINKREELKNKAK